MLIVYLHRVVELSAGLLDENRVQNKGGAQRNATKGITLRLILTTNLTSLSQFQVKGNIQS